MLRLLLVLASALLLPFLVPQMIRAALINSMPPETDMTQLTRPGKHVVILNVDNHDRKFVLFTPKGFKPGEPLPIVFFFHGAGGWAEQAAKTYGWPQKAEEENFFVAFPEGLPLRADAKIPFHVWRDGRGFRAMDIDDVHFFEVLLDKLQAALPIDSHRIYVTGFSNGAGMTFLLGAHFSDRIAAIAPVSSQSFVPDQPLARPLPVFFLTGTADPFIPYFGGQSKIPTVPFGPGHPAPPVQDSVDLWAKLNGCPPTPQILSDKDGVRVERYGPGQNGAEVFFTTVDGNGHHWPGSVEPLPRALSGPVLDPFHATDRIWEFFRQHPLQN